MEIPLRLSQQTGKCVLIDLAKEVPTMPELTPKQQYDINQVAATMELEDMPLDEKTYNYLVQLATGEKTIDQIIEEIKKEYQNG